MSGLDKLRNISSEPAITPTVLSEEVIAQTVTARNLVVEESITFPDGFSPPWDRTIRWTKTAVGAETSLSGADNSNTTLTYDVGYEQVYLNGILLVRGVDYQATTGTTITGLATLSASDVVEVIAPVAAQTNDTYSTSQSDNRYYLNSSQSGFRNRLINGDFRVNQRGTYSTTNNTRTFTADRWWVFTGTSTAGSPSYVSSTGLNDFPFALRVQRTAANTGVAAVAAGQTIESVNVYGLQGEVVTISFWARAGANFSGISNILNTVVTVGTGVDQGTIAFINATWTGQTSSTIGAAQLGTSWKKFTYSYEVPSTTTELALYFIYTAAGTAGAADYFDITGVQLETGSRATSFEHRPYDVELASCQRYYQRIALSNTVTVGFGHVQSGTTERFTVPTPVSLRTTPALTATGSFTSVGSNGNFALSSFSVRELESNTVILEAVSATGHTTGPLIMFGVNGNVLVFDSELT